MPAKRSSAIKSGYWPALREIDVPGVAVVAGEQTGEGGERPDRAAVGVRRGERLVRGRVADHVEKAAGRAEVEYVVAQERRDLAAVLAAPVKGRRRLARQRHVRQGRAQPGENPPRQRAAHPVR